MIRGAVVELNRWKTEAKRGSKYRVTLLAAIFDGVRFPEVRSRGTKIKKNVPNEKAQGLIWLYIINKV